MVILLALGVYDCTFLRQPMHLASSWCGYHRGPRELNLVKRDASSDKIVVNQRIKEWVYLLPHQVILISLKQVSLYGSVTHVTRYMAVAKMKLDLLLNTTEQVSSAAAFLDSVREKVMFEIYSHHIVLPVDSLLLFETGKIRFVSTRNCKGHTLWIKSPLKIVLKR